uniref:Uncharacterized protein n=1 Tax=Eutreptiella gymnastica TaxID=73025 RepID=A0A7S4FYB5_9EUGL
MRTTGSGQVCVKHEGLPISVFFVGVPPGGAWDWGAVCLGRGKGGAQPRAKSYWIAATQRHMASKRNGKEGQGVWVCVCARACVRVCARCEGVSSYLRLAWVCGLPV